MPAIMFIVVDLPQPEGPSSAMNSPSAISRSMVLSASKAPKDFLRLSRRMAPTLSLLPRRCEALHAEYCDNRQHKQNREGYRRDIAPDQILCGDLVDIDGDRF